MRHVVLLGDSVFDNGVYVEPGEPDVVQQLREELPDEDEATLLAFDGHVTWDVPDQLNELPDSATHLVLSVGGNDGLRYLAELQEVLVGAGSPMELMMTLGAIKRSFAHDYRATIESIAAHDLPTCLFTIYSGSFAEHGEPALQQVVDTVLPLFNDVIYEQAMDHGFPVVVLDCLFDDPNDYANAIEPSAQGGRKIARTISRIVETHPFSDPNVVLFH